MARAAVLLVLLMIHHLKATETAYREGDDSVPSNGSQEMQTDGKPNMTLVELLLPRNNAPEIKKRMGDFEEVTHGVGYDTHLDPHYYQRRDMGRYYDCAKQGPWKPIHGHRQPHGAADESHPQRHHHPQPGPSKQNNNANGNHLEEWEQQPKEIIHGQHPPPVVGPVVIGPSVVGPPVVGPPLVGSPLMGGGFRKFPPWRGKGGGGRGIHQSGVIHHHRPSGGGQPTQQVIYHVNGHQGAPLYHVHVRKPAPSIFGDDEWHHWFYSEEHGPYGHEGVESNQDHKELSSFHQAEEHVGSGGYPVGDSQEVPEESAEVEEEEDGGYHGTFRGHYSGEQGDYPAEGQRDEQSASYEGEEESQEQSTNASGESGGGQADENKLPCEEEEEEASANEGSAPPEEDLSYLEIMYPPPLPQPPQVITAPALEEPEHHPHLEGAENHGQVQVPLQQAYDTSGYNSQPPKCPYADHAVDPNHVHVHHIPSQEMLPPKQESRDTRGTMPLLPPMQQYEVYETNEDGGKDGGVFLRQPHAQQTSHFEGDVTPELVFGQRIPPKKTVLKIYGKPVLSGPGSPSLQNSLAEAANYPEEQKDGNAVLRPPPLLLRDSFPKINGMKVLLDARRKRRPSMWQGGPSGRQPVKMPPQLLLKPRHIPRRPTARMTVTLP